MNQRLKCVAAISVLLNLLLVGIIAGQYVKEPHGRPSIRTIVQSLSAEKRADMEDMLKKTEDETKALREQLKDARQDALSVLRAESFNKDAYVAQAKKAQKIMDKLMQRMTAAVADAASQASPEERAHMADVLNGPRRNESASADKPRTESK